MKYLIIDPGRGEQNEVWYWKAYGRGYTTNIKEAGRFSTNEAILHCDEASFVEDYYIEDPDDTIYIPPDSDNFIDIGE